MDCGVKAEGLDCGGVPIEAEGETKSGCACDICAPSCVLSIGGMPRKGSESSRSLFMTGRSLSPVGPGEIPVKLFSPKGFSPKTSVFSGGGDEGARGILSGLENGEGVGVEGPVGVAGAGADDTGGACPGASIP